MKTSIKGLATLLVLAFPVWVFVVGIRGGDTARLALHLSEPDVTVRVDDREYAAASPIELSAGTHAIRITRDGAPLFAARVVLRAGERKEVWARWRSPSVGDGVSSRDLGDERARLGGGTDVRALGFGGDGASGLAADEEGVLRLWDLSAGSADALIDAHPGAFGAAVVADHGRTLLSVSGDGPLRVWDLADRRAVRAVPLPAGLRVTVVAASRDGRRVAVGNEQARVYVVDLVTGREVCRHSAADAATASLAFTPDGSTLVVGLIGRQPGPHVVEVIDAESGRLVHRLAGHTGPVWDVACLPDNRRAVSAGGDGTLRIWDLATGRALACLGKLPGAARCLAVAPDGHTAVVGTGHRWAGGWRPAESYGVQVWDLDAGRCLGHFATDTAVNSVALSPDGRRALAAGDDHVLHSWDLPADSLSVRTEPRSAPSAPTKPAVPAPFEAPVGGTQPLGMGWSHLSSP